MVISYNTYEELFCQSKSGHITATLYELPYPLRPEQDLGQSDLKIFLSPLYVA